MALALLSAAAVCASAPVRVRDPTAQTRAHARNRVVMFAQAFQKEKFDAATFLVEALQRAPLDTVVNELALYHEQVQERMTDVRLSPTSDSSARKLCEPSLHALPLTRRRWVCVVVEHR